MKRYYERSHSRTHMYTHSRSCVTLLRWKLMLRQCSSQFKWQYCLVAHIAAQRRDTFYHWTGPMEGGGRKCASTRTQILSVFSLFLWLSRGCRWLMFALVGLYSWVPSLSSYNRDQNTAERRGAQTHERKKFIDSVWFLSYHHTIPCTGAWSRRKKRPEKMYKSNAFLFLSSSLKFK